MNRFTPETGRCTCVRFKAILDQSHHYLVVPGPEIDSTKNNRLLFLSILICCSCLVFDLNAANGTWTQVGGGSWTNAANWSTGIIADGSGSTANFGSISLSADAIVSLDSSRTIGNLTFDDQNTTKHGWVLVPGVAGSLTLAGGTPTITVGSSTTRLDTVIGGASGLSKAGPGKLSLTAANTYTGTTAVNGGILSFGTATFSAANPLSIGFGTIAESMGTMNLAVNSSGTAFTVTG